MENQDRGRAQPRQQRARKMSGSPGKEGKKTSGYAEQMAQGGQRRSDDQMGAGNKGQQRNQQQGKGEPRGRQQLQQDDPDRQGSERQSSDEMEQDESDLER